MLAAVNEPNLVLLQRVRPERNEARFYLIQVGPDLFGQHSVLRIWGRIGGGQRQQLSVFDCHDEAVYFARKLIRLRQRHGYCETRIGEGKQWKEKNR